MLKGVSLTHNSTSPKLRQALRVCELFLLQEKLMKETDTSCHGLISLSRMYAKSVFFFFVFCF